MARASLTHDHTFTSQRKTPSSPPKTRSLLSALNDTLDITAEFFRWEIAIAVAGSVIRINPFNQPDVEASKIATKKL